MQMEIQNCDSNVEHVSHILHLCRHRREMRHLSPNHFLTNFNCKYQRNLNHLLAQRHSQEIYKLVN